MYVNPFEHQTYFTNGVGMYFDNGKLDTVVANDSSGIYTFVQPQVQCSFIISDTLNWVPMQGLFTANGSETFCTLGNFLSDVNTSKIYNMGNTTGQFGDTLGCHCSEIIIDDISLIPVDIHNWLHDTTITLGDSVYIGLPPYELSDAQWYTGSMAPLGKGSGITVKPTTAVSTYIQAIDVCNTIKYDTMKVYAYPLGISQLSVLSDKWRVYPNPASNKLYVELIAKHLPPTTKKEIYNALGQLLLTTQSNEIDVQTFSKGLYYIKIGNEVKKVVLE